MFSRQKRALQPHPGARAACIAAIEVEIAVLPSGALKLIYVLTGDFASLRIPDVQPTRRADGLWRHTCFEAFIRVADSPAYREFNFSPSGLWQAYAFHAYRAGGLLAPAPDPKIECLLEPGRLTLHATLQPDDLPAGARLRLGLTAVVEAADGSLGYWALQHTAGKPDFHHPDTFALEIAP
jgi:hypothetical protein